MNERRFDPLGMLVSFTWTVLLCTLGLLLAVNVLRGIWPWLLGLALLALVAVTGVRLLVWSRGRSW